MLNEVRLIGRIGNDLELKYTQGGTAVLKLSLATGDKYKDKNTGELKETTEWHSVTLWNRTAENAAEYLQKGDLIFVSGSIKYTTSEKDGVKKYYTNINAFKVIYLNWKKSKDQKRNSQSPPETTGNPDDDDLPF